MDGLLGFKLGATGWKVITIPLGYWHLPFWPIQFRYLI